MWCQAVVAAIPLKLREFGMVRIQLPCLLEQGVVAVVALRWAVVAAVEDGSCTRRSVLVVALVVFWCVARLCGQVQRSSPSDLHCTTGNMAVAPTRLNRAV